ncbi:MAG: hypothetical protein HYU36_23875 [Planctomycetes bacterium]|nr:hypothetical protein [Planctomycetota bacterium]
MSQVFADTFYWLAILNPQDSYHDQAVQAKTSDLMVTHWEVIIEVMDALSAGPARPLATRFWEDQ